MAVSERGFIPVDKQMRTNMPHIFAIGDIVGQPMLAHKAVHEAHVAAETAAGKNSVFRRAPDPVGCLYRPGSGVGGLTEEQCKAQGIKYGKSVFPWAASGRAIANGRDEGFTKLLFDEYEPSRARRRHRRHACGRPDRRSLPCGRDGMRSRDIGKTIHPHPTLSNRSAWRRKCSKACALTCRRRNENNAMQRRAFTLSAWANPTRAVPPRYRVNDFAHPAIPRGD